MVTTTQTETSTRPRATRQAMFEQEIHHLMDRLYETALRLSRNPDDAEDIVAETVTTAWKKLDQLTDNTCFESWLFRILNHTFINQWRRRQCRQEKEIALEDIGNAGGFSLFEKLHQPFLLWWGTPEQSFLNQILSQDIRKAMDQLPDEFRIVMVLVEIEGYSYQETADLIGIPLGTVRSRLYRARNQLQRDLWQQGQDAGLTTDGSCETGTGTGGEA
ncbi:ECF subfamily RNA polymerase sigma-24 subunit [Marinobacter lipolyticus SM19]|uniref:ECF subfamily RNA polymerase sigma-24 subunit n=1 Tax=Marinobacter lipolyticus SM19 TaxID=1318628 RepID=R8AZ87_9GAMM|nr:sigma-70 family RNA polymerase sigma factor [Marinobacter lipolyticus]EON91634.1 ECF subfamily RNA polymerase sigma-24 subunit [Marinobacter lipolyticus SM19]